MWNYKSPIEEWGSQKLCLEEDEVEQYGNYKAKMNLQVNNKSVYFKSCVDLCKQGFTVVSAAYRLGWQSIIPAQIHDKGAIRFLRANAKKYGIDPERIGVIGNSAGGHLTVLLAASCGVEERH